MEPLTLTALAVGKYLLGHLGVSAATTTAAAIGGAAIATIVVITFLTMVVIINWFRSKQSVATRPHRVAFTLKMKLEIGDHGLVQGVFNKNTNSLEEGRTIKYDSLDADLKEKHRHHDLVVYR